MIATNYLYPNTKIIYLKNVIRLYNEIQKGIPIYAKYGADVYGMMFTYNKNIHLKLALVFYYL